MIKRLQSANISPIKKHTFTEPSLSIDQTNLNLNNLIWNIHLISVRTLIAVTSDIEV